MKITSHKFLLLLILLWIALSFTSILHNSVKSITEIRDWYFLSDTEKRQKIFGDLYTVTMLIEKNTTKKSQILLVAEEKMPYYLTRYYLYPRRIYLTTAKDLARTNKENKYPYIFAYNTKISNKNYKEIASFSSRTGNYGSLYEIK